MKAENAITGFAYASSVEDQSQLELRQEISRITNTQNKTAATRFRGRGSEVRVYDGQGET
jgi:hypothetical protein